MVDSFYTLNPTNRMTMMMMMLMMMMMRMMRMMTVMKPRDTSLQHSLTADK